MKNRLNEIIFIFIFFTILLMGGLKSIFFTIDVNEYENRTAYKYILPNYKNVINKEFQDNTESTLADQLPLAITTKKVYNLGNTIISKLFSNTLIGNECNSNYVAISDDLTTFGCDDTLVYLPEKYSDYKKGYNARVKNINEVIESDLAEVYVYFIEKDTEINFNTNEKSLVTSFLRENINTEKFRAYEINDFKSFQEKFYKTDHHWNYNGSYLAYIDIIDFLNLDTPLNHGEVICSDRRFTGSKASFAGAMLLYNEEFCAYDIKYPEYQITINGTIANGYGRNNISEMESMSYADYYGTDSGEIIFDTKDNSKNNILIVGESFDNAILKLLASHFNKTYSIDLRNYKRENQKDFNYKEYIKENDIDTILLIGNSYYFNSTTFDLEG